MPRTIVFAVCGLLFCQSCILVRAKRNNDTLATAAPMSGTLEGELPEGKPAIIVALESTAAGWTRYSTRLLYRPGPFEFLARPGKYKVFAFVDLDLDQQFDPAEPSALSPELEVKAGAAGTFSALSPRQGGEAPPIAIAVSGAGEVAQELVKVHRGDLCTLAEERMKEEAGKLGYWQPVDFATRYGVGVSMLEQYRSDRIPVVFVHGASGYPENFEKLIAAMDRRRFQPWVYSYPSGIRLSLAASTLKRILDDLQNQLGFRTLFVVAHSMGGLVARDYAIQSTKSVGHGYVRLLVTLSTPFGGHEMAKYGVEQSPVIIPSWFDMVPGSPYLTALQTATLPPTLPHYLVTSYEGGRAGGRNTDGTVSLQSQLEPHVQRAAARVVALGTDHDAILEAAETFGAVNEILADAADRLSAEAAK